MLQRLLSLLLLFAFLSSAALAEPSFFEEVSQILRTPGAASDFLPPETVQKLHDTAERHGGEVQAISPSESPYSYDFTLNVLETVYGVYQSWPIALKHDFDRLMVDLGQLSACLNLLPGPGEITQEEAEALAFAEIQRRYGADGENAQVNVFYRRMHPGEAPSWAFAVDVEDRSFDVMIQGGRVTSCREIQTPAGLQQEYEALCEERGAFFKWTIEQKAAYADGLWERLEAEPDFPGAGELRAIAEMGFCLPNVSSMPQADAKARAVQAVSQAYGLPKSWADGVPCFFSFFVSGQAQYTWRVIFWQQEGFRGLVEMDAESGEILCIREDGGTLETSIPYLERL